MELGYLDGSHDVTNGMKLSIYLLVLQSRSLSVVPSVSRPNTEITYVVNMNPAVFAVFTNIHGSFTI